jgi:hypothetical protein
MSPSEECSLSKPDAKKTTKGASSNYLNYAPPTTTKQTTTTKHMHAQVVWNTKQITFYVHDDEGG